MLRVKDGWCIVTPYLGRTRIALPSQSKATAFGVMEKLMGGSSQSTSVKIPAWLQDAAKANLARANEVSRIGYTPYYGPDVAAMTAPQIAAMQGTNQAALSFGVPTADFNSGMPQAQDYGGMSAYSSGGMYGDALAELKASNPGQYNAIMGQFIDPILGTSPDLSYGAAPSPGGPAGGPVPGGTGASGAGPGGGEGGSGGGDYAPRQSSGGVSGGYTGLRDMVNGGGPGAAGADFQGGLLSGMLNKRNINPVGSNSGGGGMGRGK